jgi:hypothetical protein
LCFDNIAGRRDGIAEIKLKELKYEEDHITLGNEIASKVTCNQI